MANASELDVYFEIGLVENYAKAFGLDPDEVTDRKSFDSLVLFTEKWNAEARYAERYRQADKLLNSSNK